LDSCQVFQSGEDPLTGDRWYGGGRGPSEDAQKALAALKADYPGGSFIRNIDPFTGKKAWDIETIGGRPGVLSTAGGLVFTATVGGITALDARTDAQLWSVNVGMSASASAMTCEAGGTQYVAITESGSVVAYSVPK
jgi:hypothetical protein